MNIPTIVVVLTALMQQLPVTISLRLEKANGCPQKFKHYESMCYGAVEKVISADPCKTAVGGDLATWHDQDTLDLISSLKWKSSKCGIGLEYSSGSWFWRNGEIMIAQSTFEEATTERSKYWSLEKTGGRSKATLAPASRYDFEDCSICQTRRVNTIYHDAAVYYPMDVWYQGKTFDAISGQYVGDQDARVDLVDSYADLGKALRPQSAADVFTLPPNTKPCSKDSCYESGTSIAFWVEMPPGSDSSEPESGQLDNFTCLVRTDGTSDYSNYSFCKYSANDAILTTGSETWSLFQDVVDASSSIWTFVVASWKGAEFRGCVWPEQLTCFVCHTFDICEGCMDLIHDGPLYFGWDSVSFDEFAVWNRPLSDAEIINLFNRSEPRLILDDASDISKLTDLIKSQEGLEADEATWILQSELSFVQADDTVTNADDLEVINELFATTLESHNTEDVMHSELLENLQIALDIVSELTRDERGHLWSLKSNKTQIIPCPCSLTTSVGDFANNIGQALLLMNETDRTYIVTSKRAAAQITPVTELQDEYDEDDDLVISLKTNSSAVTSSKVVSPDVEVSIPVKVVKDEEAVLVVVVVYDNLHDIFPARDNSTFYTPSNVSTEVDLPTEIKFVASSVIDVTFIPAPTTSVTFDTPIVFVFELESHQFRNASKYDKFTRLCVYWNTSYADNKTVGAWATNGCEMTDSNNTHVTCSCYHLTHFAVLMIREPGKIGDGHVRALTILSNIGCSLSVFGSVSTVAAFIILRMNTDRVLIHSNLASSIAMSQILFLAQGSLQPMTIGCKVMAGVMYYFFSSSFVWMMIEGLQLYTQVVLVFNQENSKMRYYVVAGWGIPLVMTGIVIGSTLESIGRRTDACWLDYSDNSIYFFVIPTLCVVIANMAILTRVTMVIVNLKNHDQLKRDDATYQKLKYALKASLTISPLMGSTWMFGVLTLADSSNLTFLYIFVLCNSIQGLLIFILHCLNSQEVRDAFKRRMEVYNIGRSIRRFKIQPTSSSMNDSVIQDEKVFRSTINTLSSVVSKEQKTH